MVSLRACRYDFGGVSVGVIDVGSLGVKGSPGVSVSACVALLAGVVFGRSAVIRTRGFGVGVTSSVRLCLLKRFLAGRVGEMSTGCTDD